MCGSVQARQRLADRTADKRGSEGRGGVGSSPSEDNTYARSSKSHYSKGA